MGAAAFGLVAGLAGKIKSARGGYDIPSGVNPITQLHEDEMVLPSQHANTIREMGNALRNGASFGAAQLQKVEVLEQPLILVQLMPRVFNGS